MSAHRPAKSFIARVLEDLAQRVEGFPLLSNVINTASGAADLAFDGLGKLGTSIAHGAQNLSTTISHSLSTHISLHESMTITPQVTPRAEHAIVPSPSLGDLLPHHVKEDIQNLSSDLNKAHVSYTAQSMSIASLNTLSPSPVPNLRQHGGIAQSMA